MRGHGEEPGVAACAAAAVLGELAEPVVPGEHIPASFTKLDIELRPPGVRFGSWTEILATMDL